MSYLEQKHLDFLEKWGKDVEYDKNLRKHQIAVEEYKSLINVLKKLFAVNNNSYRVHPLKWLDQAGRAKMKFANYIYVKIDKKKGRSAGPLIIYAHLRADGLIMGIGFHSNNPDYDEKIEKEVRDVIYNDIYPKINNPYFKLKDDGFDAEWKYFVNKIGIEQLTPKIIQDFINSLIPGYEKCDNYISNENSKESIKNNPSNLEILESNNNSLTSPLNLILYGPPGTGKTYTTVNRALEIIGEDISEKTRKEIKTLFDAKVKEGQIVFTTFHQSMSYEDFIEGIKPDMNNESLKYDVKPGIFRKICEDARTEDNFDEVYDKAVEFINANDLVLKTNQYEKPFDVIINSNKSLVAKPQTEKSTGMCITKNMMREYFEEGTIRDWKSYLVPIAEYMEKTFGKVAFKKKRGNFVLIIDEINRGNISQIFGELITLIEEDKRVGKDEGLEIVLPYSKKKFSVPSNLYIIGTMNTADRSVEALDTALRRRFCFEEMQPKPELIATEGKLKNKDGVVDGINLPKLLRMMNLRIEKLLDRDHNIGHSYFMSVENLEGLKKVFQNNIIPLLQEYFFGDYGKIGLVLGKGFFEDFEIKDDKIFADFDYDNASDFEHRKIFRLKNCSDMNDSEFKNALTLLLG